MKLEQHNGTWVATYQGEEFFTGMKDIMDGIQVAVTHFNFAQKKAV